MATLVFSTLGTVLGGPLGGAVGALLGQQLDRAVIGSPRHEGPRLKELAIQSSSYGAAIPRLYGTMRVAGTLIWSTDLVETRQRQGGGKGKPSVTSYSYSVSCAFALSSRPISDIGRIWADGQLLRGADGALKPGGTLRIHHGHGDQLPDPFIASADGDEATAFRGLAYAMFEDLPLAEFGNRIPALTFEVIADDGGVAIEALSGGLATLSTGDPALALSGFAHEDGSFADALALAASADPLICHDHAGQLRLVPSSGDMACALGEAVPAADQQQVSAFSLDRQAAELPPRFELRYYDPTRDYQIGLQRSHGPASQARSALVELPAALAAADARAMVEAISAGARLRRQRLRWRMASVDPAIHPGAIVSTPELPGLWQVQSWEWVDHAVALELEPILASRVAPVFAAQSGAANTAADLRVSETLLVAIEQPALLGAASSSSGTSLLLAAGSSSAGWRGAAIYLEDPAGGLQPLGQSGRRRATMGRAIDALPSASAHLIDWASSLTVQLADPSQQLADASLQQIASGANLALIGEELIQFACAAPSGGGQWQLRGLVRGRAGTEHAITDHQPDEPFVMIDDLPGLDAASLQPGDFPARLAAIGVGDSVPVMSAVHLRGSGVLPLAPCHPRFRWLADGGLTISWATRHQMATGWNGAGEAAATDSAIRWLAELSVAGVAASSQITSEPLLLLSAPALAAMLPAAGPHQLAVSVRQLGDFGRSPPLRFAIAIG